MRAGAVVLVEVHPRRRDQARERLQLLDERRVEMRQRGRRAEVEIDEVRCGALEGDEFVSVVVRWAASGSD